MSYIGMPVQPGDDWAREAFISQFPKAINERAAAAYQGGVEELEVGDDVQSSGLYGDMQLTLENMVPSFIDLSLVPSFPRQDDFFFGDWAWTLPAWRAAAGLHPDGFTRKYPDAGGNIVTAHGRAQRGDYIGPWLFDELRAGMAVLTHRAMVTGGELTMIRDARFGHGQAFVQGIDKAAVAEANQEAKELAEAEYPSPSSPGDPENGSLHYHFRTDAEVNASLSKTKYRFSIPKPSVESAIPAGFTIYGKAGQGGEDTENDFLIIEYEFDALGYPVVQDTWSAFLAGAFTESGGELVTEQVGEFGMPPWPSRAFPDTTYLGQGHYYVRGWQWFGTVTGLPIGIIEYDFKYL